MKKTLLFVLNLLLPMLTLADGIEINGIHYILDSTNKFATVTTTGEQPSSVGGGFYYYGENNYSGDIYIPESVTYENETYIVNTIGGGAFSNSNITSVSMPNTIVTICGNAFFNCTSLKTITISESVTTIGAYAFQRCKNLTKVDIPNKVTNIGDYAFNGCI